MRDVKQKSHVVETAERLFQALDRGTETQQVDSLRAQFVFAGANIEGFPGQPPSQILRSSAQDAYGLAKPGTPDQYDQDMNTFLRGQAFLLLVTRLLTVTVSHCLPGQPLSPYLYTQLTEQLCLCSGSWHGSVHHRRCFHLGHHDWSYDARLPL